jgi:hypothetical protein
MHSTRNLPIFCFALALIGLLSAAASAQLTLELKDYVTMPMTGVTEGKGTNEVLLARVNALREEPGGATRFFVTDLNGPMYILDKNTKKLTTYLNFDGRDGQPGLFRRFFIASGYGNGLNGFYFDPDYRRNGKFYTVHMEDPTSPASNMPDNTHFPGLNLTGYTTTQPIKTPGPIQNEGVLIEWTDTNPSNSTFEGTARELMRVPLNTRSHPMGDVIFNPTARPGDADWRVLYIECGDGASGESRNVSIRNNPQRLDNLVGKILRIIPDLNEHTNSSTVSDNGRYRIPNDNPFVSKAGARKEIWAYGLRNPHRLSWAIDPANATNNRLLVNVVGLHTWETVDIVLKGANYGYSQREGHELLKADNTTGPLPQLDKIPLLVTDEATDEAVVPRYPVVEYGHVAGGGDAIGSGFVYNGKLIPALRGKYLFTDITTGHIWYAEYKDMLAADDGKPSTMAPLHEVKILWDNQVYDTMWPINEATYHFRGGKEVHLASKQTIANQGRGDDRLAIDANGELYLYSKSDGMIRAVVGAK